MNALLDTVSPRTLLTKVAPSATDMIRADHTRVLAIFHRYAMHAAPRTKQAVVNGACTALEIHAQVEEEIFYPAMRAADSALIERSIPEHDEMRRRIAMLRDMDPASDEYDLSFMELMRNVIHHVADEETALLPDAERLLGARLGELGARMTARRLQLAAPRAGEMAMNTVRSLPPAALVAGAGILLAGLLLLRRGKR
jgi:hemerythrin superfamily protein